MDFKKGTSKNEIIKTPRRMKKIFLLSTLLLTMSITVMGAVKKTKLRVLYVGGHSNLETFATDYDKAENERSIKERTASFEQFLNEYFTTVKVVMADEMLWVASMVIWSILP